MCDIRFLGPVFFSTYAFISSFFAPLVYKHVALSPVEGPVAGDAGERSAEFEENLEVLDVFANFFDISSLASLSGVV